VPVSLLGLVVGGLIAFFIPRYFVASTLIQHEAVPGELLERSEDPFSAIVASARSTIPQAVGKAMELLKWPEAQLADPHEKAQCVREVQNRLSVDRVNADGASASCATRPRRCAGRRRKRNGNTTACARPV